MKLIKRIIAAALIAATVFCLTSCLALDKAKAHRMTWSGEDIVFNGKTYKKLPASSKAQFRDAFLNSGEDYYLTKEDVPVLLAGRYGMEAGYDAKFDVITIPFSNPLQEAELLRGALDGAEYKLENVVLPADGQYIVTSGSPDDSQFNAVYFVSSDLQSAFYVTEENYNDYSNRLRNPSLTRYAVAEPAINADTGRYREEFVLLAKDVSDKLTAALDGAVRLDPKDAEMIADEGYYTMEIYKIDEECFAVDGHAIVVYETKEGFFAVSGADAVKLDSDVVKGLGITSVK